MESIGLAAREPGLNAMIMRLKRYARELPNQRTYLAPSDASSTD